MTNVVTRYYSIANIHLSPLKVSDILIRPPTVGFQRFLLIALQIVIIMRF